MWLWSVGNLIGARGSITALLMCLGRNRWVDPLFLCDLSSELLQKVGKCSWTGVCRVSSVIFADIPLAKAGHMAWGKDWAGSACQDAQEVQWGPLMWQSSVCTCLYCLTVEELLFKAPCDHFSPPKSLPCPLGGFSYIFLLHMELSSVISPGNSSEVLLQNLETVFIYISPCSKKM